MNFSKLRAAGVNFYDVGKTALPPLPSLKVKTPAPEAYGLLDYSGDDDEPEEETESYF